MGPAHSLPVSCLDGLCLCRALSNGHVNETIGGEFNCPRFTSSDSLTYPAEGYSLSPKHKRAAGDLRFCMSEQVKTWMGMRSMGFFFYAEVSAESTKREVEIIGIKGG